MRAYPVVLLIVAMLLLGCTRHSDKGFRRDGLLSEATAGRILALRNYTDFEWDTFYVFAPYTTEEHIRSRVGASVPFPKTSSEAFCLLVFAREGRVTRAFEEARAPIDFATLANPGVFRSAEANFHVNMAEGRPRLEWAGEALRAMSPAGQEPRQP